MLQIVDAAVNMLLQTADAVAGCLPASGLLFFCSAAADAAVDSADAEMTAAETAVSGLSCFLCAAAVDSATADAATAVDVAANS